MYNEPLLHTVTLLIEESWTPRDGQTRHCSVSGHQMTSEHGRPPNIKGRFHKMIDVKEVLV